MIKIKKSTLGIFASIAAMALTSCGKKKDVVFWSSFGAKYTGILNNIVEDISKDLNISIDHVSKGSYPGILKEMVYSYGTGKYPSIAIGYPDHFAQHHGSKILRSLDEYVTDDILKDYDSNYMPENYLYDTDGTKHLYGVPFNKSTEVLGYNGVFVDYVAEKNADASLKVLPTTWTEWAQANDASTKAGKYLAAFNDLIDRKVKLYATQNEEGTASGFVEAPADGKILVLDYSNVDKNLTKLMTWDSTDNAFITLVRQWDAKYTTLPADQYEIHPKQRQGKVLFANDENLPKTRNMLKFFNGMYKNGIFGTPADVGGSFSSDAFAEGRVMFMVCSSGGLSYNTDNWEKRFRIAPIPYSDADHKYVISQGANICMTKNGDANKSFQVIKALTTGKYQTRWAIETGYFPASATAEDSTEYQTFMNGTDYSNRTVVAYREGAKVNYQHYRLGGWNRFVDDAFIGSATVRSLVGSIIPNAFKNVDDVEDDAGYNNVIKQILKDPQIANNLNIAVDSRLV